MVAGSIRKIIVARGSVRQCAAGTGRQIPESGNRLSVAVAFKGPFAGRSIEAIVRSLAANAIEPLPVFSHKATEKAETHLL